ncbi:MAG: YcfA family protein [Candidatus Curtissbacteria bacterium GW2011_GWA1_40_16]|uniref:YcfA family protein n=1 Tax=Candidatus Curtissbacteria bacterium GW2011_GWA1_40_16 TaxID=1618405 RepID=A0A0G0TLC3_9BACT|nr:MAG: YcfA family protein [Candidatus Curtissbacteria bacterium GW2011_GWA1_40_16]
MPKLPIVMPSRVVKALKRAGFVKARQTGSHLILWHPETKRIVSVPIHARTLKKGLLSGIIKEANLTLEEFLKLL